MSLRFPRPILLLLIAGCGALLATSAVATDEKPQVSAGLIEKLEAAHGAAEQDKVIATRGPAISERDFCGQLLRSNGRSKCTGGSAP
jgi:hypothetical protein